MDPMFLGGNGQKGISTNDAVAASVAIQEELALHWHYNIVIHNTKLAATQNYLKNKNHPFTAYINLANQHPEIPLGVVCFWVQTIPKALGYPYTRSFLADGVSPEYRLDVNVYGQKKKEWRFNLPDSIPELDGTVQRFYFKNILAGLIRPIDFISENGEEPPGPYDYSILKTDAATQTDMRRLGISDIDLYVANRKLHLRRLYASQFLDSIPELKQAGFSFYQVDGGPVDRFDWNTMRKIQRPINGCYYSTFDVYPRWPSNWRTNKGPWHGWQWVEDARKVEIGAGDRFCSPFISPGWDSIEEQTIRPAQWLGLLKCLSVVGAEFFYVGYFNTGKPFSKPENYIWQAAIPAYAQAVVSRNEAFFRHSNVLFDKAHNPIITTFSNDHVLVTMRRHDSLPQYMIAMSLQTSSNTDKRFPMQEPVTIEIDGKSYTFMARRQGSVYLLDLGDDNAIRCRQLDYWHQASHPQRWTKAFHIEAEDADSIAALPAAWLRTSGVGVHQTVTDLTHFRTMVMLPANGRLSYTLPARDSIGGSCTYVELRYQASGSCTVQLSLDGKPVKKSLAPGSKTLRIPLPEFELTQKAIGKLSIELKKGDGILLDYFIFGNEEMR